MLVTTTHMDELREKCESMASEARDSAVVESNRFAEALAEEQAASLQRRLSEALCELEARLLADIAQVRASVDRTLAAVELRAQVADVQGLAAELHAGLAAVGATAATEAAERAALGNELGEVRGAQAVFEQRLQRLGEEQREAEQRQAVRLDGLGPELREGLERQLQGLDASLVQARGEFATQLEALQRTQAGALEGRCGDFEARLHGLEVGARELESLPTRRVEWLIDRASQLERFEGASSSWWSPRFMVAGHGDLQLELKLLPEGDSRVGGECVLQLWLCEGCGAFDAVIKLFVGTSVEELHHSFCSGTSCAMRRCPWRDAVDRGSDTLRVGMEVLEGFRLLSGAVAPLLVTRCGSSEGAAPSKPIAPGGSLRLYRHLCPAAAERVACLQEQWDHLRSRMVGRVEWRLEQVLMLQQSFPKGQCLCSAMFSAGGVDHLQLVFYPSGDEDARACYCSFFLYCPEQSTLQCWLSVGKQRREAHRLPPKPGFLGRCNFCLFEGCADRINDTLTLAVEIAEAQQHGGDASKPVPQAVPWPALAETKLDAGQDGGGSVVYQEVIESSTKLQGMPGRLAFEDTKHLPGIWTPKPGGGPATALGHLPPVWACKPPVSARACMPEGYLHLGELPSSMAPPSRRARARVDAQTPRSRRSPQLARSLPPGPARHSLPGTPGPVALAPAASAAAGPGVV